MTKLNPQQVLSNPRLFVAHWLNAKGIKFTTKQRMQGNDEGRTMSALFTTMWLDYREQLHAFNVSASSTNTRGVRGFGKEDLEHAFSEFVERNEATLLTKKVDELRCHQEDLTHLRTYVRACTGTEEPITIAVLAHWLWMIKRKMAKLPVRDHIMPVLFGKQQGSGKTMAVKRLIGPIEDWREDLKLDEMGDSRYGYTFQQNYVLVFDEMQNAERSDLATLKHKITAESFGCRKLGTNIVDRIRQSCSFIGTSNRNVDEQIIDSSGMRRFYEIKAATPKLDWDLINGIDYLALWRGIDEKREHTYIEPFMDALRVIQDELTTSEQVEEFVRVFELDNHSEGSVTISVGKLYDIYKYWAKDNGFKPTNASWFGRRLKNIGLEPDRTSSKSITTRQYMVGAVGARLIEGLNTSDPGITASFMRAFHSSPREKVTS